MTFVRAVFRIIVGIVFGIGSTFALSPAFAAFVGGEGTGATLAAVSLVLLCALVCFLAPTIRRSLGRGFLILGSATFVLPISALLLSGRVASETVAAATQGTEAGAAVGAGLAGIAVTGFAFFIGFTLGTVFLLIGAILSLGGRREVVVISGK
jgi:hypothetical protein